MPPLRPGSPVESAAKALAAKSIEPSATNTVVVFLMVVTIVDRDIDYESPFGMLKMDRNAPVIELPDCIQISLSQ